MKKFKILISIVLLIFGIYFIFPNIAFSLDYENGHFEKINTDFPIIGQPIKLNDGRILIISGTEIINFNPKTNNFSKIVNINNNLDIHRRDIATLLNNGKVLFISPITEYPSEKFSNEIYHLVINDLYEKKSSLFTNKDIQTKRDAWLAYKQLPEEKKEEIFLPYIKKASSLFQRYNNYLEEYKKSMYAQLYDPNTNKFEYTGKINIRRRDSKKVLMRDGSVLIIGGLIQRDPSTPIGIVDEKIYSKTGIFELYNPNTQKFSLIVTDQKFKNIQDVILLNDGNIFIIADQTFYIFNPITNKFFKSKHKLSGGNFLKLKDNRIIFNTNLNDRRLNITGIACYNPYNDNLSIIGKLLIPRGDTNLYNMTLLPDGNILINGGENTDKSGSFSGDAVYEDRVELFNPDTSESILIPKMHYKHPGGWSILLDDGRILYYFIDANVYIPKGYKK